MTTLELEEVRAELASTLLHAMSSGAEGPWSEGRFDELALRVLRYQAGANPTYGALIRHRGIDPDRITDWRDAPLVPTRAFRELPLACEAPGPPEAIFRTSGTSRGGLARGEHQVRDLAMYRASLLPAARRFLRPELGAPRPPASLPPSRDGRTVLPADGEEPTLRVLSLVPSPSVLPDSSLAFMLGTLAEAWDDGGGGSFAQPDWSLDVEALIQAVGRAHEEGKPVLIAGTAFAFVHWLDAIRTARLPPLPAGSRVLETGGYKGRSREVPRDELHRDIAAVHGIGSSRIVNEYGMTELLSQFYDPVLLRATTGEGLTQKLSRGPVEGPSQERSREPAEGSAQGPAPEPAEEQVRGHVGPPWIRTRILDPVSLREVAPGEVGLLAHFDLANLDSVSAILTEDMGAQVREGFRLLGRAPGSEPRGCSLAMEDLLEAGRHEL